MAPSVTPGNVTAGELVGEWEIDPRTSEILIRHKTLWGLTTVKGQFGSFRGSGSVGADGSVTGSVTIDADSLNTGNKRRDEHLRSSDFFDVQKFPSIVVQVSAATLRDGEALIRSGLLVKGTSEPLAFTGHVEEATADALRLTGTFIVDRGRFGMSWNQAGMLVGLTTVVFRIDLRRADS